MPQFKFNTISRTDIESSLGGSQMLLAIDYEGPHNLLITGCPGSGKTTVSIMRAERLINMKRKILLITYQDLLNSSLINIASTNLAPNIVKFYKWFKNNFRYLQPTDDETAMLDAMKKWAGVDEILIDEGQDFEARIYRSLCKKCKKITVGADNAQRVYDKGLRIDEIQMEIQKTVSTLCVQLQYNYRNTFEIYNFARFFLPYSERANNEMAINKLPKGNGAIPNVFLVPDENTRLSQLKILLDNSGDRNIAILVYSINEVDSYHKKITDLGFPCSKHHHDSHVSSNIENILVTTFKSAKGLEFQVVIMPDMETAMNNQYKTGEHYYIASTRAKENLYLLINGTSLPSYFNAFSKSCYKLTTVPKQPAPKSAVVSGIVVDDLPF